jgi:hypothetical protein
MALIGPEVRSWNSRVYPIRRSSARTHSGTASATSMRPGRAPCWANEERIWYELMLAASTACCGVMPNSTTLRKNWSRFWSWLSPPCTAKARYGAPSLSASVGVSVTRGRLPGSTTLKGPSALSSTKLCIRWLSPTPVRPAITAGTHPPLGVTETTQPSSSAASIEVVPRLNDSLNGSPTDSTDSPSV